MFRELQPRPGEFEIDSINSVEDSKGNSGERGTLSITNLRIIWIQHSNIRSNLSIGFNCVLSLEINTIDSKLRGETQAIFLSAKYSKEKYEYIFTSLVDKSPRLFTSIRAVYGYKPLNNINRTFCNTRTYREVKLRAGLIKDKQLILLADEQITDVINGVVNSSIVQGNIGVLYITNIRIVWHSNICDNYNVSIPYVQIV